MLYFILVVKVFVITLRVRTSNSALVETQLHLVQLVHINHLSHTLMKLLSQNSKITLFSSLALKYMLFHEKKRSTDM